MKFMKRNIHLISIVLLVTFTIANINVLSTDKEIQLEAKTDFLPDMQEGVEQEIDYKESLNTISNPDRGFYYPAVISGTATGFDDSQLKNVIDEMKSTKSTLVHLRIDISKLSGRANGKKDFNLSEDDVADLNNTFEVVRKNKVKAIVRIAYDYDGIENKEPDSLDTILHHIEQFKPIFETNKDIITVVECGFIGVWGEMHSSHYANPEDINTIVKSLLTVVPDNITVNVRTLEMYKNLFKNEENKSNENRVGIFNDGYLGNELDLGTYTDREEGLKFLESHARYTIFGGEAVAPDNKYNDIENVQEMFRTHTTYLNYVWNPEITQDKWKKTIYNGPNSIYKGQTAQKYITDHLGYRFVLRSSKIATMQNEVQIQLEIANTGFANVVNKKGIKTNLIVQDINKKYIVSTDIDVNWYSNETTTENISLLIPSNFKKREVKIYLQISDISKQYIQFANKGIWNKDLQANYIGKFEVK